MLCRSITIKLLLTSVLIIATSNSMPYAQRSSSQTASRAKVAADTLWHSSKDSVKSDVHAGLQPGRPASIKEASPSSDSWFKTILPIITLILGIGINKLLEFIFERRQINKSGKRWIAELRALEIPIFNQVAVLKDTLQNHPETEYAMYDLGIITGLNCEIFKSLDKSEILKYIERKKNLDSKAAVQISNKIHGFTSIVASTDEALRKKYEEHKNGISKHIEGFNLSLQALLLEFTIYGKLILRETRQDPSLDQRYQPILALFNAHILPGMRTGEFDLFQLQVNFFEPLSQIFTQHVMDENVHQMAVASSKCTFYINGIRMEKRYWKKNMEDTQERYEKQLLELEIVVNTIE